MPDGYERKTTGWRPSCDCDAGEPVPCVVLDCFGGSGTTGVVALELGRSVVLIDLNEKDCAHTRKRLAAVMPLFRSAEMQALIQKYRPCLRKMGKELFPKRI